MTPLAHLILGLLGLLVERGVSAGDGRSAKVAVGRTLDIIFCLPLIAVLAVKLGAFHVSPLEARGYDAIVPLFALLAVLLIKAVVFVLLPTVLVCWFLRRFESLVPRLVIYGLLAVAGFFAWQQAEQQRLAAAAAAAREHEAEQEAARLAGAEQQSMEQARVNAARRESEDRQNYQQQILDLRKRVRDRWRADMQAAGSVGADGELPPLLQVVDSGQYEVRVTNHARSRSCVKLVRVLRKPGTDIYLRCPVDLYRDCTDLARGAGMNLYLVPDERSPACRERQFEFRIGTPFKPEPSWWSLSALQHFDESPPDVREPALSDDLLTLRGEIQRLEKILADTDRAQRWRQAVAPAAPAR